MTSEKIHKVLARSGIGSRRQIEGWISEGRISCNGKIVTLGERIDASAKVTLDGRAIKLLFNDESPRRVLLYNKPLGEICTQRDPEGRPSVFDNLPPLEQGRWISVGRLDINTTGLIIFTNDGDLANILMHPGSEIDREYAVRVLGQVEDEMIKNLKQGVLLDDGMARFTDVQYFDGQGRNQWYHCVIMEGRKREVRRLWESQGLTVSRLKRVRFGPVFLPSSVRAGTWLEMSHVEADELAAMFDLPPSKQKYTKKAKEKLERRYNRQQTRRQVETTKPGRPKAKRPSRSTSGSTTNAPRRKGTPRR